MPGHLLSCSFPDDDLFFKREINKNPISSAIPCLLPGNNITIRSQSPLRIRSWCSLNLERDEEKATSIHPDPLARTFSSTTIRLLRWAHTAAAAAAAACDAAAQVVIQFYSRCNIMCSYMPCQRRRRGACTSLFPASASSPVIAWDCVYMYLSSTSIIISCHHQHCVWSREILICLVLALLLLLEHLYSLYHYSIVVIVSA